MKIKKTLCRLLGTVLFLTVPLILAVSRLNSDGITILMYHNITTDPNQISSVTVTDERFRLDMEFLDEFGYTSLLPKDLIEIQKGKQDAPERAVMVTFDDGYRSNYEYAYPILKETGTKAVIAVIVSMVRDESNPESNFMNWEELKELQQSGIVEIGSHTYAMHNQNYAGVLAPDGINGIMRKKDETRAEYNERIGNDLKTSKELIEQNTGIETMNYFAYPFGVFDEWMQPLLRKYDVNVSVLTWPGHANIRELLHKLPRFNVTTDEPLPVILRHTNCLAEPVSIALAVYGNTIVLPAYNIEGENYVRADDLALAFKGSENEFDVSLHDSRLEFTTGTACKNAEAENTCIPSGMRKADSCIEPVTIDGIQHMVASFLVDGNIYLKPDSILGRLGIENQDPA